MIEKYIGLHVKCPLFLLEFNETSILSTVFRKVLKYQISLKSVQWEPSCSMGTDGHDEANSRFSPFCVRAQTYKTKSPTRLTVGSTVAATCTYCPFCQHSSQGRYFIWQLPVVTFCRLVYRTDAAL